MSLDLCHRSATDLAAAVRSGELSPVDLVRAHLDRIDALGDRTNAFVTVLADEAMERAREAADQTQEVDPTSAFENESLDDLF